MRDRIDNRRCRRVVAVVGVALGATFAAACAGAPLPLPAGEAVVLAGKADPPGLPGFGGDFRGVLRIFGDGGDGPSVREVPMGLTVLPDTEVGAKGRWLWQLHYGEGAAAQLRDYRLVIDDERLGHYRIDEQNGVVLLARRVENDLVSIFQVGDQVLDVRYRAVPGGVEFALEAFSPGAAQETGGQVKTLGTFARQRAMLRRGE